MSTNEPRPEPSVTGSTPEQSGYTPQSYSSEDETRIIPGGAAPAQQVYGTPENNQQAYGNPPYGQATEGQGQYGQQAYGQPQQGSGYPAAGGGAAPYGQPQYGQQYDTTYGQQYGSTQQAPGYAPSTPSYASWGSRVGARLIDGLVGSLLAIVLGIVGFTVMVSNAHEVTNFDGTKTVEGLNGTGIFIMILGSLFSTLFNFWNLGMRQGKTGQSIGKKILKIKVVDERTGQPAGTGMGIARFGAELAISLAGVFTGGLLSIVDVLWPLWDSKNQTLHDKMVHTVVVPASQV